ncbi:MAG: DUF4097 family beta strand repeat-containing protein [Pseudomonadota bacterium]
MKPSGNIHRRGSLALYRGLVAMLAGVLACSAAARDRAIDELFKTGSSPRVDVSNVNGEIDVAVWSRDEVELQGTLDERAELVLEHDDDKLMIRVVKKSNERRIGVTSLRLRVPTVSDLSLHSVSGNVRTAGIEGSQRIDVVSGDIDVTEFGADLDLKSVSGNIRANGTGEITIVTALAVSGDIELQGLSGELELTTISGTSSIDGGEFTRVDLDTTSGDISFSGDIDQRGRLDAETISGDVEIVLVEDTHLDVSVETFSGDIDSCFKEQPQKKSKYGPGKVLSFKRDDASKDIRVETMSGDVGLCGS